MAAASRPDTEDQDERDEPPARHAGVRDLIAAYPWLPIPVGLLLSAFGVWCFAGLAEQVYQGGPVLRVDEHLLRVSLGLRSGLLVGALSVLTWLGDVLVVLPVSLAIGVLIGLTRKRWGPLVLLAVSSAGTGLAVYLFKIMIARPRPQVVDALVVEDGFGFPSGHSAHAAALYLMLGAFGLRLLRSRWARGAVFAGAVLAVVITGFSRVVLGVHSPTDVLAGWALGASWTVLLLSLWLSGEHLPRLIDALVARKRPR
ncbi:MULTISPECIES: phosphatase PAP2 family protein [unclassified Saccharopolyspora]|uniref:phosphatase PAP2 family protein n=1 Tax=unclassified Saccharopolyspora TaxID=2646250 RepID=UPI001CD4B2FC|nr:MULTISPECIES: phosphatase PAP2 family protein [unclassified Saccharopolyspora]MCA1189921.1 phosphatase PAP2 family protein [Saccharopolyspora sp. 6T]MCA1195828.1 phosphatase PAP2 family protein [Saccharopolyspora sp. 6V]MCA1229435.1 phosphatase PAP2 family protein [Saccharopolyspora sp. 6M]MCA1283279.1 phosphatase PAP2 family protein [Saccharopolyspora sp. 7B]